jgi:cytochrome P450
MVMANAWAANHDPAHFEKPEVFNPDRFMDIQAYPGLYPFGIGRRSCPGDQFALNTLIIMLSKLASSFDFAFDGPGKSLFSRHGSLRLGSLRLACFPMECTRIHCLLRSVAGLTLP